MSDLSHLLKDMSESEKAREALEKEAISRYRARQLSHRQLGNVLGKDYWQTEEFLKSRNVEIPEGPDDLEQDRKTIEYLKGRINPGRS